MSRDVCEDPFSAEFETHVEGVEETTVDDEVRQTQHLHYLGTRHHKPDPGYSQQSPLGMRKQLYSSPVTLPKPNIPVVQETNMDEVLAESLGNPTKEEDDEEWPPPPDELDVFGAGDGATPSHTIPETQPSGSSDYPLFINCSTQRATDTDDSWSTTGDQGSKLSILEEVDNEPDSSRPSIIARTTDSDRARARSEVIRNRQMRDYENFQPAFQHGERHNKASRTQSCGIFQYENIVLPSEVTRHSSGDSSSNSSQSRSTSAYENVFLPEEHRSDTSHSSKAWYSDSNSQNSSKQPGSSDSEDMRIGSQGTPAESPEEERDNLAELEHLSDDGSYYTDSDFDNEGEEIKDFLEENLQTNPEFGIPTEKGEPRSDRLRDILRQLTDMETAYVRRLHFMCRVVLLNLRVLQKLPGVVAMPQEAVKQIFTNIEVIFEFHSQNLLPALENLLSDWDQRPNVGKTFNRLVPYFKLYLDFQESHKQSLLHLAEWRGKSSLFAALLDETDRLPESENMTVKDRLIEVSNQVPKYQAALKEFSDALPRSSEEENDLHDAVESLTQTCFDLAKATGKEDRMKLLKDIQSRIDVTYSIVKATRQLITETRIKSVHPANGRLLERHIFLFNDLLLLCGQRLITGKHEVRFRLDIKKLQVHEGDNLMVPHTFYVQCEAKAFELACRSDDEKIKLMQIVHAAIIDSKHCTIFGQVISTEPAPTTKDMDIGKRKPEIESCSPGVQLCTLCGTKMGTLRRRYHCMACGKVVCVKCSQNKAPLEYDNMRLTKVCDACYAVIHGRELASGNITLGVKQDKIKARDPRYLSSYLQLSSTKGRRWHRRWFVVHSDGVLYCFKGHNASHVWSFLPLRRFSVAFTSKSDPVHKNTAFKLFTSRRTYYLQADTVENAKMWMSTLSHFSDSVV